MIVKVSPAFGEAAGFRGGCGCPVDTSAGGGSTDRAGRRDPEPMVARRSVRNPLKPPQAVKEKAGSGAARCLTEPGFSPLENRSQSFSKHSEKMTELNGKSRTIFTGFYDFTICPRSKGKRRIKLRWRSLI